MRELPFITTATDSPRRRRLSVVGAFLALLIAIGGSVSAPQAATADHGQDYYSVPYTGTMYNVFDSYVYPAEYSEWSNDGFPTPMPAPTEYVKYSWSSSIYAVSYMEGATLTKQLGYSEWQRAGFPRVRAAGHVEGTTYHEWATGPEIFATAPDGVIHKLTYSEWAAAGFRPAETLANRGYQKLSWDGSIAYMYALAAGDGYNVSYPEWQKQSFPRPQTVSRFPNDEFCRFSWSSDIYYFGPSKSGTINYSQWRAAGFPRPTVC